MRFCRLVISIRTIHTFIHILIILCSLAGPCHGQVAFIDGSHAARKVWHDRNRYGSVQPIRRWRPPEGICRYTHNVNTNITSHINTIYVYGSRCILGNRNIQYIIQRYLGTILDAFFVMYRKAATVRGL